MTRKDYEAIAGAIREAATLCGAAEGPCTPRDAAAVRDAMACTVVTIANRMAEDNPRFDRERFYVACGADLSGTRPAFWGAA